MPQGSIIGPLLYICFTNDMPECVHDHNSEDQGPLVNTNFNLDCLLCGSICCYADDSTYSKSSQNAQELTEEIDRKYKDIVEYINSNKLVINTDKTHLLVMCSQRSHNRHGNHGVCLNTGSEIIYPVRHEKLLGGHISDNFTWNFFIRDGKDSLYRTVVSRINTLSRISRFSSFKTRKTVANGIVMSRFVYLIQVWGLSCSGYLIKSLQLLQNRAARIVTGLDWFTPVDTLLQQCGWLSIFQLVHYHSLVLVYQVKADRKPIYFSNRFNSEFSRQTRLARGGGIRRLQKSQSSVAQAAFQVRAAQLWNDLPVDIRRCSTIVSFKGKLKKWIKSNISTYP